MLVFYELIRKKTLLSNKADFKNQEVNENAIINYILN